MVFLLGAVTMLLAFLLVLIIPEVSIDVEVEDKKISKPVAQPEPAGRRRNP